MKKQSLFLTFVLGLLATPLLAKHSVSISNQWDKNITVEVVSSHVVAPGERKQLRNLNSTQDVKITAKRGKVTVIPALPDAMITDRHGVYRPLSQGYSVTIDKSGNVSSGRFTE